MLYCLNWSIQLVSYATSDFSSATMTKIIKEMLPPDVRVARDAQDLLIECCVGEEIRGEILYVYLCCHIAECFCL